MAGNSFQSCGIFGGGSSNPSPSGSAMTRWCFHKYEFFLTPIVLQVSWSNFTSIFWTAPQPPNTGGTFQVPLHMLHSGADNGRFGQHFWQVPVFCPTVGEKNRSFSAKVVSWDRCVSKTLGICHISPVAETSQVMAEAIPPQQNHCSLAFAFPFGHLSGFQFFDSIEKN